MNVVLKLKTVTMLYALCFFMLLSFFISKVRFIAIPFINYVDEFLLVLVLLAVSFHIYFNKVKKWFFLFFITFFIYSLFLILRNDLPLIHLVQSLITIKYVFIFYLFYSLNDQTKAVLLEKVRRLFVFTLLFSVPFTVFDFVFPNYFYELALDGRGLGGVSAGSIFGSRVLYSEFILVLSSFYLSIKIGNKTVFNKSRVNHTYVFMVLILSILLILTFSRKEILIFLAMLFVFFISNASGRKKYLYIIFALVLTGFFLLLFWIQFKSNILENFNEGYVRYKIFAHAVDIFNYYSPYGSGPGTYGSVMSKSYPIIYEKFDVSKSIIGWGSKVEGPIFDLFFVSLFAEYGIGVILFLFVLYKIFTRRDNPYLTAEYNIPDLKVFLFLQIFVIGFFVPILGNIIGFLIFIILGLVSSKNEKTIKVNYR